MPHVVFTPALQRHLACPPSDVEGGTVREALEIIFRERPAARNYVFDEQGTLRKHMMVFVDGEPVQDRDRLSDGIGAGAQIYVMQALSGG
jgi:sulfur-carrier protein